MQQAAHLQLEQCILLMLRRQTWESGVTRIRQGLQGYLCTLLTQMCTILAFHWPLLPTTRNVLFKLWSFSSAWRKFCQCKQPVDSTKQWPRPGTYWPRGFTHNISSALHFIWVWLHFIYFWVWKVSHFRHILPIFWIYYRYPSTWLFKQCHR